MSTHTTSLSNADLRSNSQPYKRDAAHKHKWALGAVERNQREGGAEGKAKPVKPFPTNIHNSRRRHTATALAASAAKSAKFRPAHPTSDDHPALSSSPSSGSNSESTSDLEADAPEAAEITYTYDHPTGPVAASEILTAALARAVERFEDAETVRLVKGEWDVLDEEGEVVRIGKGGKAVGGGGKKMVAPPTQGGVKARDVDEDWEVV
ncbi:unnamed protein product [Zymoseptoria tritici ST99CH_3D1]|uniref:Uncharacterized protein n=2 Tax=Zymoseptoria tritici TaxID=1047171 RepID=A0A1X7RIT5_ZYMT9|nr:unnamed protein product [Zymoseptoria tritici ST99CH_3D7]SMR45854.1 unnamed protein product [Zymoseptoria tritici ST99CH_1E4]SMR47104.1 unnamed protein product [Zymoseptoria tritici ST99CH_3D1]